MPPVRAVGHLDDCASIPQLLQDAPGPDPERHEPLDRAYAPHQLRQDGRLVSGAGADLEHHIAGVGAGSEHAVEQFFGLLGGMRLAAVDFQTLAAETKSFRLFIP